VGILVSLALGLIFSDPASAHGVVNDDHNKRIDARIGVSVSLAEGQGALVEVVLTASRDGMMQCCPDGNGRCCDQGAACCGTGICGGAVLPATAISLSSLQGTAHVVFATKLLPDAPAEPHFRPPI
jgi:hypothetical protein